MEAILFRHLLLRTEETVRNLNPCSLYPGLGWNREPPEYKSEVLPLEPASSFELGSGEGVEEQMSI
jgi:hypothetical protein